MGNRAIKAGALKCKWWVRMHVVWVIGHQKGSFETAAKNLLQSWIFFVLHLATIKVMPFICLILITQVCVNKSL